MGLRGPKSAAESLTLVPLRQPHPAAPKGLPKAGKTLWDGIVTGYPPGHFSAGDMPLLENYVRAVLILDAANDALGRDGIFTDSNNGLKPHPAIGIRDIQVRNMATLATKLRLPVSSRIRADSADSRPGPTAPKPWEMHGE